MNMTQYTTEFIEAYNLGKEFAKRIRVGKRFFGSMPIAEKIYKGGSDDNHKVNGFFAGFHSVIEHKQICFSETTGLVTGFVDSTGKFSLK